ncbi:ATP phosphoribosyltransferase [Aquihabitans sp. G128]|uniref:ATP phosphoribosyltransferase n=1 Tax=Aquihabitans sp. G128 TaxID=2849779 RepID=UPI001C2152C9|nr:ATP phosphoribosyltransferase [Aquihabitans sp. G128]QXC60003.1 ATP phosphoribosyltransferase [Aquihabitans sp. G128]
MIPTRVAIPSRGRLRDFVLALLDDAGFRTSSFRGTGARAVIGGLELVEMRPRDAAAWLGTGRVDAAFISTDLVLEEDLGHLPAIDLGAARSDLVVASRDDDGRTDATDLGGAIVATHLPVITGKWFAERGIDVKVVAMGGALEGVCAAGLADAIVDLRETGSSLAQNRLRVLDEMASCQALFVHDGADGLAEFELRLRAVLDARRHRYVMFHLDPAKVHKLTELFPGLAAPTMLPLAERDDLVAVHIVTDAATFWSRLQELRDLGASGIVALPPDALVS